MKILNDKEYLQLVKDKKVMPETLKLHTEGEEHPYFKIVSLLQTTLKAITVTMSEMNGTIEQINSAQAEHDKDYSEVLSRITDMNVPIGEGEQWSFEIQRDYQNLIKTVSAKKVG